MCLRAKAFANFSEVSATEPMISWDFFGKTRAASFELVLWISGFATSVIFSGYPALAQSIIQDSTTTLLNGGSSCSGACIITGGTANDGNIIHSFQRFNVDTGTTVIFDDPGVVNIIGKITAIAPENLSTIDGILAVNGTANLFLLNPNGIIFGPDAALDIPGSFIASTAENVIFDPAVINSGRPDIVPLLTLSVPVGLQMGTTSKDIVVSTPTGAGGFARLGGLHGQTLAFIGRNVELTPGAEVQVFDILGPSGGVLHLQATEALTMTGATVENGLVGHGEGRNRVILDAPTISLTGGTQVILGSFGSGELGQIDVNADTLIIDSTNSPRADFIGTASVFGSTASGGDINIQTENIRLVNGGSIFSNTLGAGEGGKVSVQNTETVEVVGFSDGGPSSIAATAIVPINFSNGSILSRDTGAGGEVIIDTARLTVVNGGQIVTGTQTTGDAGDVTIYASESVTLAGNTSDGRSGLFANALFESGAGGNVMVTTPYLTLKDGATINVSNSPSSSTSQIPLGTGAAGNIVVQDARIVLLDDHSLLTADTVDGGGANINLEADAVVLKNGSLITTSATGRATGGNIDIEAGVLLATGNSDITANAINSFGGKISVDARGILGAEFRSELTSDNDITAFSQQGVNFSGQVRLITSGIDPIQGAIALPQTLANKEQIQAVCGPQTNNAFVASGRGGLPEDATQVLRGNSIWQDLRWDNEITRNAPEVQTSPRPEILSQELGVTDAVLIEAQGLAIDENGQVELISTVNNEVEHGFTDCLR